MRLSNLSAPVRFTAAALFAFAVPAAALAQTTPFSQLAGAWHGGGQVKYTDGSNEHLNCRGKYSQKSGGRELSLTIRCQSANNKVDMTSDISYEGGHVSGHWSERNFGLEGDVAGSATPTKFSVRISGQLQGSMTVSVNGATHYVSISTAGPGFKSVSIAFSKG